MEQEVIIGLSGRMGSGKDTAAAGVSRWLNFAVVHFADPLKLAAQRMFGFTDAQLYTGAGKNSLDLRWGVTPRDVLQRLGVGAREIFGEDFWVKRLLMDLPPQVVVADVRFPNEAQAIKDRGGRVIRIERGPRVPADHISETALDDWAFDAVIENDGTVAQLQACTVDTVLEFFPQLRRSHE